MLLLAVAMTPLTHRLVIFFFHFFLVAPAGDFGFEQVDPLDQPLHQGHRHSSDRGGGR